MSEAWQPNLPVCSIRGDIGSWNIRYSRPFFPPRTGQRTSAELIERRLQTTVTAGGGTDHPCCSATTHKKRRQNKTGSDGENSALTKQTNLAEQEMYLCITLTIRQSHIICHMLQLLRGNHKFLRISSYRICWMEPLTGPLELDLKVGVLQFSIQLREAPKKIIFC